jgi:hypothetical protein
MQCGPWWTEIPRILTHCRETLHRDTDPMRQTSTTRAWIPPRADKVVPCRGGSRRGRTKLSRFCRMSAQFCAECSRGGAVLSGSQETARAHCGNVSIRRANISIRCGNVWIVLADASLCRVAWVSLAAPRARVDGDNRGSERSESPRLELAVRLVGDVANLDPYGHAISRIPCDLHLNSQPSAAAPV